MEKKLTKALELPRGVTAFVGGGGKTALINALARELAGEHSVLIATTTHIYPPPFRTLVSPSAREVAAAMGSAGVLAAGSPAPEGKLGALPELSPLYPVLADAALVEADGARGLPLKAPDEREPQIPPEARLVVAVAGLDGIGLPISRAAHRPQLYAEMLGAPLEHIVAPADAARVLMSGAGQMKKVECRFAVVLNKADTPERAAAAKEIAGLLPCTVLITALEPRARLIEVWRDGKCLQ